MTTIIAMRKPGSLYPGSDPSDDVVVEMFCSVHTTNEQCYYTVAQQDAQLPQRDRAARCVIVLNKSGRLELGRNILWTL